MNVKHDTAAAKLTYLVALKKKLSLMTTASCCTHFRMKFEKFKIWLQGRYDYPIELLQNNVITTLVWWKRQTNKSETKDSRGINGILFEVLVQTFLIFSKVWKRVPT